MAERKSIEARIAELRRELQGVEGTPTEVYSRIVGYYRSVRNWNAGKREEYRERVAFSMPAGMGQREGSGSQQADEALPVIEAARGRVVVPAPVLAGEPRDGAERSTFVDLGGEASLRDNSRVQGGILVFTREACPNCSPVANYVVASGMKAVFVDVDRDEGLALARDLGVMATPTVLGLDGEGRESFRAFDLPGLKSRVEAR